MTSRASSDGRNLTLVKALTYLMFAMFAMTTDSVGVIIPEVIRTYQLSLTAAGTFQYATMTGIAVAGLFLGSLADRFGRRPTIVVGLTLFAAACFLLASGDTFLFFAVLLGVSGLAIGIFKTGALALIGDISTSTAQHTSIMNAAEGFFGVGAIIGPAILVRLLAAGVSWKWLYGIAGVICVALIVLALVVRYPEASRPAGGSGFSGTGRALKNPYVLAFSTGAFLYVGVEAAIYVWMPTLLQSYGGVAIRPAAYSISVFFILRAAGRFFGAWMLTRVHWQAVLALFSGGILLCFVVSMAGGSSWAVYLLPLSGLFMSVVYPTINSKGISCLPKAEHGAAAGVILFFTCVSAVLAPLAIGVVSDAFGRIVYGFWLATGLAALLFLGSLLNWLLDPTRALLEQRDATEYSGPARPRGQARCSMAGMLSNLARVIAFVAVWVAALTAFQQGPARPQPAGSPVALVGGTLIDGTGAAPIRNSVVLIRGERIERIGTTESVAIGPEYERISTEGMTVMPGMWDLHVHLMYGGHPNGRFWFDTYTSQFETVTIPGVGPADADGGRDQRAGSRRAAQHRCRQEAHRQRRTAGTDALRLRTSALEGWRRRVAARVERGRRRRRAGEDDPVDRVRRGLDQAAECRAVVARRAEGRGRGGASARSEGGGPCLQRSRDPAGAGRRRRRLSAPADTNARSIPPTSWRPSGREPPASRPLYWTVTVGGNGQLNAAYLASNPEYLEDPGNFIGMPPAMEDEVRKAIAARIGGPGRGVARAVAGAGAARPSRRTRSTPSSNARSRSCARPAWSSCSAPTSAAGGK